MGLRPSTVPLLAGGLRPPDLPPGGLRSPGPPINSRALMINDVAILGILTINTKTLLRTLVIICIAF